MSVHYKIGAYRNRAHQTPSLRMATGRTCPYCGKEMVPKLAIIEVNGKIKPHPQRPTRDHMIPFSRGGMNVRTNISIICLDCNQKKGSLLPEEFVAWREGRASRIDKGISWRTYPPKGAAE